MIDRGRNLLKWSLLLLVLLSVGCASGGRRTQELLERDLTTMSDDELLHYYYELSDQIAAVEGRGTGTSIGIGGGSGGFGIGVGTAIGGRTIAEDLRERRTRVLVELNEKGIRP